MNTIRFGLAFLTVCMASPLRAAVVEGGALPGMGMVRTVPAFRAAVLDQIAVFSSLSNKSFAPAPSMPTSWAVPPSANPAVPADVPEAVAHPAAPRITANPTVGQDPVQAAAERLVGALVAQPQVIARHQEELLAALGAQGAGRLKEASARLEQRAAGNTLLAAQLKDYRQRLDLGNARSIEEFGARLDALFENSKSRPGDPSSNVVAAPESVQKQKKLPSSWKMQPATARAVPQSASPAVALPPSNGNAAVVINGGAIGLTAASGLSFKRPAEIVLAPKADRPQDRINAQIFSRIPGVDSVMVVPVTYPIPGEPRTRWTDVYVNFHSAEALETAKKSGSLPLTGALLGWITGYRVIARVSPEAVARERAALGESYRERFSKIPGVDSVDLVPVTRGAIVVEVPTGRTDVFVNFHSAAALAAAKKSSSLPLFGDLRGWFTGYHVIARVRPSVQKDR